MICHSEDNDCGPVALYNMCELIGHPITKEEAYKVMFEDKSSTCLFKMIHTVKEYAKKKNVSFDALKNFAFGPEKTKTLIRKRDVFLACTHDGIEGHAWVGARKGDVVTAYNYCGNILKQEIPLDELFKSREFLYDDHVFPFVFGVNL